MRITVLAAVTLIVGAGVATAQVPCPDADSDGFADCTVPDCDDAGLTCGDCRDDDFNVNPNGTEICNHIDDDCDGMTDNGSPMPTTTMPVEDDTPEARLFGEDIASIGDVDSDSVPDFVIAHREDREQNASRASVAVISGATFQTLCVLTDPDQPFSSSFGRSVAGPGDLTGDGVGDVVVGNDTYPGAGLGSVLVFSGADCQLVRRMTDPTGNSADQLGYSVAGTGDLDGDGVPDVASGAIGADMPVSDAGAVVVFSGADGSLLHKLVDPFGGIGDRLGWSVAGIGDVTGDMIPDVAAGAPFSDSMRANGGTVAIFSGADGSLFDNWNDPQLNVNSEIGTSVAGVGDVSGDGVPDVAAGQPGKIEFLQQKGEATVFSGADGTVHARLRDLFGSAGDRVGTDVAAIGDIDGDGFEDVAVGATGRDGPATDAGSVYLFSGSSGILLREVTDPLGRAADALGQAVAGLLDLGGDGVPEFAAGAPMADTTESVDGGRVLVVSLESDCDGDGSTPSAGDCDDQDSAVSIDAEEICDTLDNDCDGITDEDDDGDGFAVCDDCNDTDARIFPGADERCNGIDDDCDMAADEGSDADMDGFQAPCDCDDTNGTINETATEVCDHIDNDCDGGIDPGEIVLTEMRTLQDSAPTSGADLGWSVATLGDLDGDGGPEIAAGAPDGDGATLDSGKALVFDGIDGSVHCELTSGIPTSDFGTAVARVPDATGDGLPDVAIGSPNAAGGGAVQLFSGGDCSFVRSMSDDLGTSDRLGSAIAAVGDLTGDGIPELLVGAPKADVGGETDQGRAVVFDTSDGTVLYRLYDPVGFRFDELGHAVAKLGDIDGDGVDDMAVSSPGDDVGSGIAAGSVLLFSGAGGTFIRKLVDLEGAANDGLGYAVSGIEDVDGDAVPDVVAGARASSLAASVAGAVIVFSGADGSMIDRITDPAASSNDKLGTSVTAVPDADGDGLEDVAAGAPGHGSPVVGAGMVLLFSSADGSLIRRFTRSAADTNANLGQSIDAVPDFTGDTVPELVAGAPGDTSGGQSDAGRVVVYSFGSDCDGDGRAPLTDCDDTDSNLQQRPGPTANLRFTDATTMTWDPPASPGGTAALAYDVIRSSDPADFETLATCVETDDGSDTTATDLDSPTAGDMFGYLPRAQNGCGDGSLGLTSDNQPRTGRACP